MSNPASAIMQFMADMAPILLIGIVLFCAWRVRCK